uniref:Ycf1 n=1 Tax=Fossombronia foveolata TaxID=56918 RepID=UPI00257FD48A|nr:Ycf1 [Fossombronia foveolata]WIA67268.1 Ycf1 [Fossombronia foveolata]
MIILMSQAYLLRRIWGIWTNNGSYSKHLSKSWTSHSFIGNTLRVFMYERGITNRAELNSFREKNWKKWLENFDRYNLSPKMWYGIVPRQWRFRVSEHRERKGDPIHSTMGNIDPNRNLSIFVGNSLSSIEIGKRNELFKKNLLTCICFDPDRNSIIRKCAKLDEKSLYRSDVGNSKSMNRVSKYPSIRKRTLDSLDSCMNREILRHNLLSWLAPAIEWGGTYSYERISDSNVSAIKRSRKMLQNHELIQEREPDRSIRQWRWKSKSLEKRFKKLGSMASLMTFMQNQEAMIPLSGKMREDLDLFRIFFRRNSGTNQLTTSSEHRLPRFLGDQILMYKMVGTSLRFRQRLEGFTDLKNLYGSHLGMEIPRGGEATNLFLFDSFNLEEILLPKHRREFRVLNSLSLSETEDTESSQMKSGEQEQDRKIGENKNRKIKRFIWSSYRFEDLICMNRFWFGATDGSRSSMLRFRMYPPI